MPINAQGYLQHIRQYLNLAVYGDVCTFNEKLNLQDNELIISEKIENSKRRIKLKFTYQGDVIAIKLDKCQDPLFHFLNTPSRPWARRCDFVIFHCKNSSLNAYCIEFKQAENHIPVTDAMLQLHAGAAWVKCLNKIIATYTGESRPVKVSKYLFTACRNPMPDLDASGKYLKAHPSIRHYLFSEVDGMALEALENQCFDTVN